LVILPGGIGVSALRLCQAATYPAADKDGFDSAKKFLHALCVFKVGVNKFFRRRSAIFAGRDWGGSSSILFIINSLTIKTVFIKKTYLTFIINLYKGFDFSFRTNTPSLLSPQDMEESRTSLYGSLSR